MATPSFTLDEAMSIASQAFLPYRCVTLPHAGDASFAMHIHDDTDREILSVPHVARSQYCDPVRRAGRLEQARRDLERFTPTPARQAMLDLADFCVERAY